jgi:hypothetical protein
MMLLTKEEELDLYWDSDSDSFLWLYGLGPETDLSFNSSRVQDIDRCQTLLAPVTERLLGAARSFKENKKIPLHQSSTICYSHFNPAQTYFKNSSAHLKPS